MRCFALRWALCSVTILVLAGMAGHGGPGAKPTAQDPPAKAAGQSWLLREAVDQLSLHPRDAYLQYVVFQLWRRHGRPDIKELETIFAGEERMGLFPLFPSTLALQERLQAMAMTDREPVLLAPGRQPRGGVLGGALAGAATAELPPEFVQAYAAGNQIAQSIPCAGMAFPGSVQWACELLPLGKPMELGPILSQAVQRTRQEQEQAERDKLRSKLVAIADLKVPAAPGRPWTQLLDGRDPPVSVLSRCVPEDFFFIEFRSPSKMFEALQTLDDWMRYLVPQGTFDARSHETGARLARQLALNNDDLKPFADLAIAEVAVTGSDPFVQEGNDVTLLFRLKQPKLFHKATDDFLERLEKQRPDVRRVAGKHLDVDYVWLSTADHAVHLFAANPQPDLHVRSNSRAALERVLETIRGRSAGRAPVRRLGDSAEFKYMRTLWPASPKAEEEDGFVYLSEAFLRNLTSPRLLVTEHRRLLCYNHLRMIGHGAQLYRTEHGKSARSLAEIAKADCSPGEFNQGKLVCPCDGVYTLSPDGQHGLCTHHGRAHALLPCLDIPVALADGIEADWFKNATGETLPGPIALRLQLRPERYRVESLVPFPLPFAGKELAQVQALLPNWRPEPLDDLPVPRGNLFTLNVRLPTEVIFRDLEARADQLAGLKKIQGGAPWLPGAAAAVAGMPLAPFPAAMPWNAVAPRDALSAGDEFRDAVASLFNDYPDLRKYQFSRFLEKGLGNQIGLHVYDARILFDMNWAALFADLSDLEPRRLELFLATFYLGPLTAPMYLAAPVRDAKIVDDFLAGLDEPLAGLVRQRTNLGVGNMAITPDYYKLTFPGGLTVRAFGVRAGPIRLRMFWARIGDGFYVANNAAVLEDIHIAEQARRKGGAAPAASPHGHVMLRLRPENWNAALPGFKLGWAEANREACYNNLGPLSSAARAFTAAPTPKDEKNQSWDDRTAAALRWADRVQGVHHFCPEGGRYLLSKDGKSVTCSVHGASLAPRQPSAPSSQSTLDRIIRGYAGFTGTLTLRPDAVHAVVVIDRKVKGGP